MPFDLATYLQRLGLQTCAADLCGLKTLQAAQINAIPFENVLPFLGKVPDLDPESRWQKLVVERCGGYCFELNSLLGEALDALGFSARQVLARVRQGAPEGGARSHLAFVVTLGGSEWLVDAGFGGQAPAEPVRLCEDAQPIRDQTYRTRLEETSGEHVLERLTDDGWFALYGFDRVEVRRADIEGANYLCAAAPFMPFAGSLKAYRLTDTGFLSFQDGRARRIDAGEERIWQVRTADDLRQFFQKDLGLGYGEETLRALAARLADRTA